MQEEYVNKSRLFRENFLPGGVIRLRNNAFARVVGTHSAESNLKDIDINQLISVTQRFVREWDGMPGGKVSFALSNALNDPRNKINLASPSKIYITPFPLLLQCNKCKVLDFYLGKKHSDQLKKVKQRMAGPADKRYIRCKNNSCSGRMTQLPYVSVHRCGIVEQIPIPFEAYKTPNVGFIDKGGSFFHNSFIDNVTKEHKQSGLQRSCNSCPPTDLEGKNRRSTKINAGEAFHAQSIQYICLRQDTGRLATICTEIIGPSDGFIDDENRDIAEGLAAALIGTRPLDDLESYLKKLNTGGGEDEQSLEELNEEINKLKEGLVMMKDFHNADKDSPMYSVYLITKEKLKTLEKEKKSASGYFDSVREYVKEDVILHNIAVQRRTFESLFIEKDADSYTWDERIESEPDMVHRNKLINDRHAISNNYNVLSISHLNNINVVLATIGFSREKSTPNFENAENNQPIILNGFTDEIDESLKGKMNLYAMSAKTEGLLIKFDPKMILKWCIEAMKWPDPGDDITSNEVAARAYLLSHSPSLSMEPRDVQRNCKDRPLEESAPFHLMHTLSHCLLANVKRHTGYEDKSVMEYLLPMDFSMILYVTSVQNYTSGGLYNLFKHYLRPWFDDASNYALNCVFDPICSDKGGSCSGCTQIVIGCETFNHGLSRAYVHGGELPQHSYVKRGFWS